MFCPSKYSVQFSHSVVSNSLQPHRLQHARLPCPSSAPGAYSNSCPLSRWYHPTISSSVVPFSSCLQSGSLPMSQFFTSDGQSIGISASASVQILGKELTSCWLWGLVVNSSWVVHWRKVLGICWEICKPLCPGEFREGFLKKVAVKQALKARIVRIWTWKSCHW